MNSKRDRLQLPELKFTYNQLEPFLTGEILEVHHKKHHNGYVNKYNNVVDTVLPAFYKNDVETVQKLLPKLHFLSGGHNCHALYWENLAPHKNGGGILPNEKSIFTKAIAAEWGNYDNFMNDFNAKTGAIRGSGWGWLALDPVTKRLSIEQTFNQDNVISEGKVPLLTVDVWEHAYYLQYKNLRADYLKKIWNVINWRVVEERYIQHAL